MKSLSVLVLFAALLLSLNVFLSRQSVLAHGVQCYVNRPWFNGRTFEAKTVYSVEGVLRIDYSGKADNTTDLKGRYIISLRNAALRVRKGHLLEIAHDPPKKPSVADAIAHSVMRDGVAAAIPHHRQLKKDQAETYDFSEPELNRLGDELLKQQRVSEAIEVFKLNVEMFPNAFNVYDILGEAYLKAGDQDLAAKNYRKSLELNPHNANAIEILNNFQRP